MTKKIITDGKGNTKIQVTENDMVKTYTPKEYEEYLKSKEEEKTEVEEIDYSEFTVSELKDKCREEDLKVSGTKTELIERLAEK